MDERSKFTDPLLFTHRRDACWLLGEMVPLLRRTWLLVTVDARST